jgi:hypothetical protein
MHDAACHQTAYSTAHASRKLAAKPAPRSPMCSPRPRGVYLASMSCVFGATMPISMSYCGLLLRLLCDIDEVRCDSFA